MNSFTGYPKPGIKMSRDTKTIKEIHESINQFIKLKENITSNINNEILKNKTLGVHCRRSDMLSSHPEYATCNTVECFFQKTMKIFNEGEFKKIYLSTEEIDVINYFKDKIPDKILFQECYRFNSNETPVFSLNENTKKNNLRKNHKYLLGKEVLIDCINLSKCDSLLCGISGVSNGAMFFNGLNYKNVFYFDEL